MANVEPINQQPISDDQELAKILAGVNQEADTTQPGADAAYAAPADNNVTAPQADDSASMPADNGVAPAGDDSMSQATATDAQSSPVQASSAAPIGNDPQLDAVKQEALNELRPLVDKLDVSAEEKFDTYLLLLRSTDDRELIAPAHEAAKSIVDEARRAQALLDIIKEIDFLSQK